jgi:hypothetical protein
MPDDEFARKTDGVEAAEIYWREMLYRIHCTVIVSFVKSLRWIDGFKEAQKASNYYSYVTNLRGFIESTADSFYTLKVVNLTISKDFEVIRRSLIKDSVVLLDHKKLEESLIHFTHAARVEGRIKLNIPKHFSAKQIKQYLDSIDDEQGNLDKLYSFLSSIAHPTGYSNMVILEHRDFDFIITTNTKQIEAYNINKLSESSLTSIHAIFTTLCICGFLSLKLINKLGVKELSTTFEFEKHINGMPAWKEMLEYIDASIELYDAAERSGKYNQL